MDYLEMFEQQLFDKYNEMALNSGKQQEEINKNIEKAKNNLNNLDNIIIEMLNNDERCKKWNNIFN
jgi:hypothetical protein